VKVDPKLGGEWKEKEKLPFSPFSTSPPSNLLRPSSFPLTSRFYFTIVLGHYLHIPYFFPWPINYDAPSDVTSPPHIHCRFGLVEDPFFVLEIMASHMATSYGPQATQMNEEPAPESFLDLTLTQHPRDENLAP
jgi:hypothetical protein